MLTILILVACEEDATLKTSNNSSDVISKERNSIENLITSTTGQKEWTLMGDFWMGSVQSRNDKDFYQYGYAMIWGDKYHNTIVDGGDITIADIVVTYDPDPYYSYGFSEAKVDPHTGYPYVFNPTFGATAKWKMVGNSSIGVSAIDEDIYIPKEFICTNTLATYPTIDNSQDFTLTWETDPSNPNGKVAIIVEYNSFASQGLDPTHSDVYFNWSVITDDDGSYTIPSSVLDDFPDNSYLTIQAGRGKRDVVTKTEGVYRFVTMTYISYEFKVD